MDNTIDSFGSLYTHTYPKSAGWITKGELVNVNIDDYISITEKMNPEVVIVSMRQLRNWVGGLNSDVREVQVSSEQFSQIEKITGIRGFDSVFFHGIKFFTPPPDLTPF